MVGVICLAISLTSSASTREELERAAELAVERAAERVAEKAVEKALEAGNSSTETETIRASHSSIRKYDFTEQLPSYTILSPEEREDMLRIEKEREAGELAVEQIKHSLFRRQADDYGPGFEPEGQEGSEGSEGGDDFEDIPGFGPNDGEDTSPGFGDDAKRDEDDVSPGFGRLGRLPFLGLGFEDVSGPGDYPSSRFVRQYPYGDPYQNTHYKFVPVQQDEKKEKTAEEKKEPPVRIYQVETKPLFYHTPPINHYAAPFVYQPPQVKILKQGEGQGAGKEKRERRPF